MNFISILLIKMGISHQVLSLGGNLINLAEVEKTKQTSSPKGNDAHLRALGRRYYACPYKFKMDQINSKREQVKSSIF